ncbi:hypothetical protein G4B88_002772 [Cannabis sativa]|uniref:RNase H type-1 domain-containing protein n=1 Tax=Cannabis sativa TaxID=3483 RepID=A0A7J6HIM5_CANSA|nr:hypothetical protein G4B88_002772 [Cannabis sativa]
MVHELHHLSLVSRSLFPAFSYTSSTIDESLFKLHHLSLVSRSLFPAFTYTSSTIDESLFKLHHGWSRPRAPPRAPPSLIVEDLEVVILAKLLKGKIEDSKDILFRVQKKHCEFSLTHQETHSLVQINWKDLLPSNLDFPRVYMITDASWDSNISGLAVLLINRINAKWEVKSCKKDAFSAMEAETKAILMALLWAKEEGIEDITIFSDAQLVVNAFNSSLCPPDWRFKDVSLRILELFKSFSSCRLIYMDS